MEWISIHRRGIVIISHTYHMTKFAGLPALLPAHHLIFVQDVIPHASLCAKAVSADYSAFTYGCPQQTMAGCIGPRSCSSLRPHAWCSLVTSPSSIYCTPTLWWLDWSRCSGPHSQAAWSWSPSYSQLRVLSILVGDFNCMSHQVETRRSLDAWVAMGAALRAHVPLVEEEAGVYMYHMAAESRHGHSSGFQRVGAANGDILSLEAAVQGPFLLLHYHSRLPNHPH
jgi:hypothetical protein